ncbi:hypothetical protein CHINAEXTREME_08180 [Halobiforma lacisalsi AJ5]|uniref:Uncharacterized protein n=1 Tax=Natronobacterium lacisalsi AJ5 TaxID=358396 RepID=M0LVN4_NATLA|nr:hypothetical protein [Halobiforma lacisalsi]APW97755.1 hypothetical protein CHINAEXTREME_08180 [Halobiforma lacisalsi AJ5]EMA37501.1 hypothetical protein C445_01401 [Halobiforma lacisalsi AJ5]
MALTAEVVGMLAFTLLAFWGVASWALVRTLRQESRKVEILEHQDRMDTYSPRALEQLREWIRSNPNDPLVDRAREQYNECVDALEETDRQFYDWSEEEIRSLERL